MLWPKKAQRVRKKLKKIILASKLFDRIFYLSTYPDIQKSKYTPLEHYIRYGMKEDRKPNADFDPIWYRTFYPDVEESGIPPFLHYIKYGLYENRFQGGDEWQKYERIRESGHFDEDAYRARYRLVKATNALLHFIRYGDSETEKHDVKIVTVSGLFDAAFYNRNNPDVSENGIDPLSHFCFYGWKEGRNPNADFETSFYLGHYEDIAATGKNPFVHWIRFGREEGRLQNNRSAEQILIKTLPFTPAFKKKLAHFRKIAEQRGVFSSEYYLNSNEDVKQAGADPFVHFINYGMFEKRKPSEGFDPGYCARTMFEPYLYGMNVFEYLLTFDVDRRTAPLDDSEAGISARRDGTILFYLSSAEWHQFNVNFLEKIRTYLGETSMEIKLLFERGGPMLETFKEEVDVLILRDKTYYIDINIVEHLEFLKQFIGEQLSMFYFAGNVGDAILTGIYDSYECMIVAHLDESGQKMLSGRTDLLTAIDVIVCQGDPEDSEEQTRHWAEVPVLHESAGERFAEQNIQNVQRLLSMAAKHSALKQPASSHAAYNRFNVKKRLMLNAELERNPSTDEAERIALFRERIGGVSLVTFDIFDTLIERSVISAKAVFSLVELQAKQAGKITFDFKAFRVQAELEARRVSIHEEITFDEIYDTMGKLYGFSAEMLGYLKQLEKACELKTVRVRTFGKKLLLAALEEQKQVLLLSDMYLDEAFVRVLLEKAGLNFNSIPICLSSALRRTKHHGTLYDYLLQTKQVAVADWLHVGDNGHSDIAVAEAKGIATCFVPSTAQLFARKNPNLAQSYEQSRDDVVAATLYGTAALHDYGNNGLYFLDTNRFSGDPVRLGYEALGPVLLAFVHYVYKTVQAKQYRKVFFISRDGFYLKLIYDRLRKYDPRLPESYYFLSSRIMSYGASMHDEEALRRVADKDYFPTTLRTLLVHRFGFDEALFGATASSLRKCGFDSFDDKVVQQSNHNNYVDFVMRNAQAIIRQNAGNARNFQAYVAQSGIDNDSVIVDIGYAGSLQSTLKAMMHLEVAGLYFVVNEKIEQLRREGLVYHAYIDEHDPLKPLFFKNVQLFELFFSATHPSVTGIDDAMAPRYDASAFGSGSNAVLAGLHEGAMRFAELYLQNHFEAFALLERFNADIATQNLFSFFATPDFEDARLFEGVVFEDRFGANTYELITSDPEKLAMEDATLQAFGCWASASRMMKHAGYRPQSCVERSTLYTDVIGTANTPRAGFLQEDYRQKQLPRRHVITFHFIIELHDGEMVPVLESLEAQFYPHWTATFIADEQRNGSVVPAELAERLSGRYRVVDDTLSAAVSRTVAGDWIVLMESPAVLRPDFLGEVFGMVHKEHPDVVYTDHDAQEESGLLLPAFKPDFSPELLLSQPYYFGAVVCVKRIFMQDTAYHHGSCIAALSFDAALKQKRVAHIPKVLYRAVDAQQDTLDYAPLIKRYLDDMDVRYDDVFVQEYSRACQRPVYTVRFNDTGPDVAIIIPTKNKLGILRNCLESLERTTYRNYRVYIIDNESDDKDILDYFDTIEHTVLPIASPGGVFSYAYINNTAVSSLDEELILFLNNDVEVIAPQWLSQMVGLLQIRGVGAVGARLFYGNGKLQHVGIVNHTAPYGLPAPAFKLIEGEAPGYLNYARSIRNFAAMSAACMLTRKELFVEMGGFDADDFPVAYNDCDYGFRLTGAGYRNVVAINAELFHLEGVSRGIGVGNDKPSEEAAFVRKYKDWVDPYYNPNLTQEETDFSIATRVVRTTPDRKLRCVIVTHNLNYEGAPLIQFEIAKGLKQRFGMEVAVLSPEDGALRSAYEHEGIEVQIAGSGIGELLSVTTVGEYLRKQKTYAGILGKMKPDVVMANTVLGFWAIEAAHDLNVPSVWVIHESEPPFEHLREHNRALEAHGKKAMGYAYRNIFVARSTMQLFKRFDVRKNFLTIHNGFDASRIQIHLCEEARESARAALGIAEKFVFICPGVVSARKAQIDAVEAFDRLPKALKKSTVVLIVGDRKSDYSDALHAHCDTLDEASRANIHIVQETKEISRYYNASDAFLFTSHLESFPKVIQEAMYLGLPIVSTNTFGIAEQVYHGSSALLCDPGNVDMLSANMRSIIQDETLRNRLRENAYAALRKLPTYEEMVEQYNAVLQEAWLTD